MDELQCELDRLADDGCPHTPSPDHDEGKDTLHMAETEQRIYSQIPSIPDQRIYGTHFLHMVNHRAVWNPGLARVDFLVTLVWDRTHPRGSTKARIMDRIRLFFFYLLSSKVG